MSEAFIAGVTEIFIFMVLITAVIVFTVKLVRAIKKHISLKKPVIFHLVSVVLLGCAVLFAVSHGTYYKYNDWYILGNDINKVVERYGKFDKGSVEIDRSGSIRYYIYEDNGPIMPNYLDYYYCIDYDENGIVYKVEVRASEGG